MHIRTNGIARIKDKISGQIYEIEADQLEWEVVGGSERQMGPETEWQAETNHPALGDLAWKLWEYPAGAENYQNQELNGHELVENFTITLEHDPEEPDEVEDSFQIASRALAAGRKPIFGSQQEQLRRQDVLDALAKLEIDAPATSTEHGGVGHNNPPSDQRFTDDELREMRDLMRTIRAELQQPQPNAPRVVEATRTLRHVGQWTLARITKGADAFVDTLGKTAGVAAIPLIATMLSPDQTTIWTSIGQVITKIGTWLLTAMEMM